MREVNGMWPGGGPVPAPMISATCSLAASRVISSEPRACAAMPSPSLSRPSRMCSVPMYPWPSARASSWAKTTTWRAWSVNRSNISALPADCLGAVQEA